MATSAAEAEAVQPFHLAIPVHDLEAARAFYGGVLGLKDGRSSKKWHDYSLYGGVRSRTGSALRDSHRGRVAECRGPPGLATSWSATWCTGRTAAPTTSTQSVRDGADPCRASAPTRLTTPGPLGHALACPDGDDVPVPHFGVCLTVPQFHALAERLKQQQVQFIIAPHIRFEGQPGEQWTMFFKDPSGNNLEFKAMTNPNHLFAKYHVD